MTFLHTLKQRFTSSLIILLLTFQISSCGTDSNLSGMPANINSGISTNTDTVNSTNNTNTSNASAEINLSWIAPAEREDESSIALSEIAGYRVLYGNSHDQYTSSIMINDSTAVGYTFSRLPGGTYYFVVTTIDTEGRESRFSPEVTVVI